MRNLMQHAYEVMRISKEISDDEIRNIDPVVSVTLSGGGMR